MILNVKRIDGILRKFDINISQFYFLHCLHTKEYDALLFSSNRNLSDMEDIDLLEDKGYIEFDGHKGLKNCIVSKEFIDALYLDIDKAGQEFFDAYPSYLEVNGRQILAKKGDKDLLMQQYCEDISYDAEKHQLILKAMKIAKQKGILNMAIRNFIESKLYDDILSLLDKPEDNVEFREMI